MKRRLERSEKLANGRLRGGLGKTRKYPQWLRDLVNWLFAHSSATLVEMAAMLPDVPLSTITSWTQILPLPSHRSGKSGSPPRDVTEALEAEVKQLREENEVMKIKLDAFELSPEATDSLIARARVCLKATMGIAKPGELAQVIGVLQKQKIAEKILEAEARKAEKRGEIPAWFRDWVFKDAVNFKRPEVDEHSRGIIPDSTTEDAGDLDPTLTEAEGCAADGDEDNDDEGAEDDDDE